MKQGGRDKLGQTMRVVELFAGVGGFRLGLEGWNGASALSGYRMPLRGRGEGRFEVVWSNQWEPSTATTCQRGVWRAMGRFKPLREDLATVSTTSIQTMMSLEAFLPGLFGGNNPQNPKD